MPKSPKQFVVAVAITALALPLFAAKPEKVEGAYYVAFKDGVNDRNKAALRGHGAEVTGEVPEAGAFEIQARNPIALQAIMNNPKVLYVEEVPMRYKLDLSTQQLAPTPSNGLYGLLTTKATDVHATNSGAGIKVGVADTQLDVLHPDIAGNLINSIDCVTKNPCRDSGWQNDGETHATHVAGTILAVNNTSGILGVAYSSKLSHARVLGPSGGSSSDIMRGVRWLVETEKCQIVNLSLGGGLKSRTEENFYKEMRTKGALVVAATGNDGATRISYPAAYAVNVAVGAVDKNDVIATFSNKGSGIDVTAPGVLVLSSVPAGTGKEAAVTTDTTSATAFGLEFAGTTTGTTGTLVNCGIGNPGECATGGATNFIALIQRGTLDFATKVTNATNQGAAAAIIYNNAAGDFTGTLGAAGSWKPAVSVSDAAGATLLTKVGSSTTVVNKLSSWDYYDGTSMATPHAAGVAALIWASKPLLKAADVETRLKNGCDDKGAAGYDTTYGYGRVNAVKSINLP